MRAPATPLLEGLTVRPFTEIGEIHLDPVSATKASRVLAGTYVERLAPCADDATVVRFVFPDEAIMEEGLCRLFGRERYAWLAAVKRRHGSANVLRLNHNIRPSSCRRS
ncbi:hypothetical protein [Streptomyces tendae]|uniref:hypothetical protein n=1 Tax=Streptomyces tendae TaxID=1932 RepID=UPI003D706676